MCAVQYQHKILKHMGKSEESRNPPWGYSKALKPSPRALRATQKGLRCRLKDQSTSKSGLKAGNWYLKPAMGV